MAGQGPNSSFLLRLVTIAIETTKAVVEAATAAIATPTPKDASSLAIDLRNHTPTYTWETSDAGVATVDQSGVVTGVSADGPIVASAVADGGLGYAPGDTGTIDTGNGDAAYEVLTVDVGGVVLTYSLTAPGTGYAVASGVSTTPGGAQAGVGAGFEVDITNTHATATVTAKVTRPRELGGATITSNTCTVTVSAV